MASSGPGTPPAIRSIRNWADRQARPSRRAAERAKTSEPGRGEKTEDGSGSSGGGRTKDGNGGRAADGGSSASGSEGRDVAGQCSGRKSCGF